MNCADALAPEELGEPLGSICRGEPFDVEPDEHVVVWATKFLRPSVVDRLFVVTGVRKNVGAKRDR